MLSAVPVECPPALLTRARQYAPLGVAIANATTPLAIQSAHDAHRLGFVEPVFVGRPADIQRAADDIGWNIEEHRIEAASGEAQAAVVATKLAANGEVGAIMKGQMHTATLMRAVIDRDAGLRGGRLMSHVFHMTLPGNDKALCITDAVLNVLPSVPQKVQIAKNAVALLHALGYTMPKVAVLSATETPSTAMPSSVEAAEVERLAERGAIPNAIVEGPLAFDLAVSEEAARIKGVNSPVAGKADVLLVPNIETGNALFKMMVNFMSAAAAGIVLGAKVPIVLTSRSDPVAARLASLALAAIYVQSGAEL